MNSGWLGFSLSSSSAARGYGEGGGEGGGCGGGDGGSCSSPADGVAAPSSPIVGVPLHSAGGSVQYDGPGNKSHATRVQEGYICLACSDHCLDVHVFKISVRYHSISKSN